MKLWEKISIRGNRDVFYYDTKQSFQEEEFATRLYEMIGLEGRNGKTAGVLFLCIGTDRSTGDSLGPLIGYKLNEEGLEHLEVIGTLERPVHAMNLETYQTILKIRYPNYVVVAVDASVGNMEHIGYVTLGRGALKPGLGVSKELRAVGDIFITGIVGSLSNYDPLMLQSIRLSIVMRMADCISRSICLVEKLWDNSYFL
ncbi:spore protease YyaC [Clostridium sp. E02]|uniref:spore protease YyaC n=1 Tax=Clostridium sp. E02 TaxID=2487134 RepID=UPI000F523631|nr:spore protease YyaC [Clostridium sp. E02]